MTSGVGVRLLADAFPGVAPDEFAAWCWGYDAAQGTYLAYVVGPDGSVETVGTQHLLSPPPPGPPYIE